MSSRLEGGIYVTLGIAAYGFAVLPHVVDYGWAWGWPGAGLGFPLALLGTLITIGAGSVAVALAVARPKLPRTAFILRIVAVPLILIGPGVVFGSFGGLATSEGRGLAARVRKVTPLDRLQRWAAAGLAGASDSPLPDEVARTLPRDPRVDWRGDHVVLSWYDQGVLVGPPQFRPLRAAFFQEEIRPGIYVYVVEH